MTWQPIETAPKNKEVVTASEYGVATATREGEDFWYLTAAGMEPQTMYEDSHLIQHPTHWMPLPEPPQAT